VREGSRRISVLEEMGGLGEILPKGDEGEEGVWLEALSETAVLGVIGSCVDDLSSFPAAGVVVMMGGGGGWGFRGVVGGTSTWPGVRSASFACDCRCR
jgi:hypothetical protein